MSGTIVRFPVTGHPRPAEHAILQEIEFALQAGDLHPWERQYLLSARACLPLQIAAVRAILDRVRAA
jgi:hypothetical protein